MRNIEIFQLETAKVGVFVVSIEWSGDNKAKSNTWQSTNDHQIYQQAKLFIMSDEKIHCLATATITDEQVTFSFGDKNFCKELQQEFQDRINAAWSTEKKRMIRLERGHFV